MILPFASEGHAAALAGAALPRYVWPYMSGGALIAESTAGAGRCRPRPPRRGAALAVFVLLVCSVPPAGAGEALIAAAANFSETIRELETRFEAATPHRLRVALGSTGRLYAQILHGAPYDVLLAADQAHPRRLEEQGLAVAGSRFTYATGRLALWSADPQRVEDGVSALSRGDFRALAVSNPELAPYGAAAHQVLEALGLRERLRGRVVTGQNAGQTHSLVATRNAELGFVALSHVQIRRNGAAGSHWEVPAALHDPLHQDAVLLARAASNPAARAFVDYLQSPEARALIARHGYRVE